LLGHCQKLTKGKRKFRFKNKLYSVDATLIELCLSMYDWAKYRKTKGAIKLHMLLDHDGYLPTFVHISDGKMHEVKAARLFPLTPGSVVTTDRGYMDFTLFNEWIDKGIYFLTRMKNNADYEVVEKRTVRPETSIRKDEIIRMRGYQTYKKCPHCFRRIEMWDEKNQQILVFLTNHFQWAASTIARIYQDRWQIETFFKTIKQNLKIKTFVGTSFNAVMIQIWTALIAVLLLKYLQLKSKLGWALSNLVALLRMQLFVYRDLWNWIDQPFQPPPFPIDYEQLKLALN
jgi:IS4 transposase